MRGSAEASIGQWPLNSIGRLFRLPVGSRVAGAQATFPETLRARAQAAGCKLFRNIARLDVKTHTSAVPLTSSLFFLRAHRP